MKIQIINLLFFLSFFFTAPLFAQANGDEIVGYYLTADPFSEALSQVHIYKVSDNKYEGVVTWCRELDRKKYEGYTFLKGIVFESKEQEWKNGTITYPGKNGTFKAYFRFEKDGRLRVRGYWGISMFGKTVYWTREEENRKK